MALNIKNQDVETLLEKLMKITGETETEAVRKALEERYQRLTTSSSVSLNRNRLNDFLNEEIWAQIPYTLLGSTLRKVDEEQILGVGESGI